MAPKLSLADSSGRCGAPGFLGKPVHGCIGHPVASGRRRHRVGVIAGAAGGMRIAKIVGYVLQKTEQRGAVLNRIQPNRKSISALDRTTRPAAAQHRRFDSALRLLDLTFYSGEPSRIRFKCLLTNISAAEPALVLYGCAGGVADGIARNDQFDATVLLTPFSSVV